MNKQAHNYIFEYHDAITSGRIRAGKWIKAIYKILVEGIKNGEWVFDRSRVGKPIVGAEKDEDSLNGIRRMPFGGKENTVLTIVMDEFSVEIESYSGV